MKFNKWTIGLAAAGVVSLASAARAEEKASSVMTALSSTTLSGYVDTSAQWNFGTGNANNPPYKFGGASKADGFNLNVVQLRLEKPLDEAEWAAGYKVDLWAGPDANVLGTQSLGVKGDFAVRQAYVALRAPFQNGIDFKVGVFDSILGYESVEGPNNPNYTRSYGHSIEPQTHTGLLASYRFNDNVSASVGVANTYGPAINERAFPVTPGDDNHEAESYKTYMASIALTAPDSFGFLAGSTLYGGFVNGFNDHQAVRTAPPGPSPYDEGNSTSYYLGATVATPVTGLRTGIAWDYLDIHSRHADIWSVAGYASYQATEKLSLHGRAEYFKDKGHQGDGEFLFGSTPAEVMALTATAQYDLWKNVLTRVELRWDHSLKGNEVFGGSDPGTPNSENAWMLGANVVYKF